MSWDDGWGPADDDEPLARPFLTSGPARPVPPEPPSLAGRTGPGQDVPVEGHQGEIRPYLLTGGRTGAAAGGVALETVVVTATLRSALPAASDAAATERARILWLAETPASVAELAARLGLPLQVVLVLVADLVAERSLHASMVDTRQADDVHLIERLIAGVAAL